ncbi:MAG: winged helix-turn-helix transcriptional regulator [bacterium]|nr:winged helix-turn-helix transcriptional regulator [bacterium]
MDDTIRLDRRSFEALAAESRVKTLKALSKRRKTLTELSKELGLSVSTMKEHLDVLVKAGLIMQMDEGRKWKYYELTRKGKGIVSPYPAKVLIMLAVSLILVFGSGWNFINAFGSPAAQMDYAAEESFMVAGAEAPAGEAASLGHLATDGEYFAESEPTSEEWAEADSNEKMIVGEGAAPPEEPMAPEEPVPEAIRTEEPFPMLWAGLLGLGVMLFLVSLYYLVK